MARPDPLNKLIEQLQRLPGIGAKSAARLAYHVLKTPREEVERLVRPCARSRIASPTARSAATSPTPIPATSARTPAATSASSAWSRSRRTSPAIEKTRDFNGLYHVLMGALSPLHGVGPDDLKIRELLGRVAGGNVEEVILATNPNVEGEATAIYLAKLLKPLGVRVTRIAMGVPVGSDLEYTDEVTMHKAMEGRREV